MVCIYMVCIYMVCIYMVCIYVYMYLHGVLLGVCWVCAGCVVYYVVVVVYVLA